MSLVLGLDVSTTATKAVLQDAEGIVRAVGTSAYDYETPHPLWSEQDPGLWWDATRIAVRVGARRRRAPTPRTCRPSV